MDNLENFVINGQLNFISRLIYDGKYLQVPRDLNQCPIRIVCYGLSPYVLPPKGVKVNSLEMDLHDANITDGFEVKLAQSIADKMNLKAIYQ